MAKNNASSGSSPQERRRALIDAARKQVDDAQGAPGTVPVSGSSSADQGLDGAPVPHLDSGGSSLPAPDSFPGYRILREIHRGAQGVVYQAVQESMQRKVAIKVMREGPFAGSGDRARFDREVRLLGQLDHPNIITIHGTGEAGGCHYFVMDYISGQPLDVYMAGKDRSVDETLRLFARICEAVASAHMRGIIHRDLKPSNIRVDTRGKPYVLDFGLAKSASDSDASITAMTGRFLGTPAWASPEQAAGLPSDVDVRSDVYSLGVILFQMLTGRFPYDVTGSTQAVLERIIHVQPVRPRGLRRRINDEVETIALKCLSKDPNRRYQSAGELARDVGRYLAGEPIEAKRDSLAYIFRKQLRRHRPQAFVAASFLLLITVGLGVSLMFWSDAVASEQAAISDAKRAKTAFAFLQTIIEQADPMQAKGDSLSVREVFDQAGPLIDKELSQQPEVQAAVHDMVGNVYRHLGRKVEAQKHIEEGLRLRLDCYGPDHPEVARSMNSAARLKMGRGDWEGAQGQLEEAMAIQLDRRPDDEMELAETQSNLGQVLIQLHEYREAEAPLRRSLDIRRREANGASTRKLGQGLLDLGSLMRRLARFDEADELLGEVLPIYRDLFGPEHLQYAIALNHQALLMDARSHTLEAVPLFRQSLNIRLAHLTEEHDKVLSGRYTLAVALYKIGGQNEESSEILEPALTAISARWEDMPERSLRYNHLAAMLLLETGQRARAAEHCDRVLEQCDQLLATYDEEPGEGEDKRKAAMVRMWRTRALCLRGEIFLAGEEPNRAIEHFERALDLYKKADLGIEAGRLAIETAMAQILLGVAFGDEGRCEEAAAHMRKACRALIEIEAAPRRTIEKARRRVRAHVAACGQEKWSAAFLSATEGDD